jgi:uncharacterized protein
VTRRAATREQTIRQFLTKENTLVLSTATREGAVRSAPLFYLLDDREFLLYWLSSISSEHSVNAVERPDCAVSVFHATDKWKEIAGVQMTGAVGLVPKDRRDAIVQRYCERFSLGRLHAAAVSQSGLFQFRPAWVRYIDNSKGFGYKFEMSFERDAPD